MTIKHVQSICAIIEYDGTFVDHSREDTLTFIDDLIEVATKAMQSYGFRTACIKEAETDDTLVFMESDWQDDFDDEEEKE